MAGQDTPQVFVSYASKDRARVLELVQALEKFGVTVWRDQDQILGGENYGPKIVQAIKAAKIMMICCSDAAMRSKNVKQEIQLGWHYGIPYFPLLLEPVNYPEQVEYWLTGWQYVDVAKSSLDAAIPRIVQGLRAAGLTQGQPQPLASSEARHAPRDHLERLWNAARLTDQIWPVTGETQRAFSSGLRDLGAPQTDVQHDFRLGRRVRIVIESERETNLLLINKGTSGKLYCLCPSLFAPDPTLHQGMNQLPQKSSPHPSFVITGTAGREHLLAIVSSAPLGMDWMPMHAERVPARLLSDDDVRDLLRWLQDMPADSWSALATYFEILP
jgi:hypothetical protein